MNSLSWPRKRSKKQKEPEKTESFLQEKEVYSGDFQGENFEKKLNSGVFLTLLFSISCYFLEDNTLESIQRSGIEILDSFQTLPKERPRTFS